MNRTRKFLLYFLYIFAVTVFCIYYLFPSDIVKNQVISRFNTINSDIDITIDQVRLAFPIGLKLYNVKLYYNNNALFKTEQMKVVPRFLSLFRSRVIFFFKGSAFDGILEGRGEFAKNNPAQDAIVVGKLSGINIKEVSAVKHFIGRHLNLTGILEGDLTYSKGGKFGKDLEAKFVISGGELELLMPVLKLGNVPFSKIEADLKMKNQMVKVNRCIIEADQLEGSISGFVNLSETPGQSRLRLSGVLKPNPEFFSKSAGDLPANIMPKQVVGKSVVRIRIYGTLDEPRFFFN